MDNRWETTKEKYNNTIEHKLGPTKEISKMLVKLVEKRFELGMTQKELAEKSGLKQSAVARMENFSVLPRLDTLIKAFRVLDLEFIVIDKTEENNYEIAKERAERMEFYNSDLIYESLLKSLKIQSRISSNIYYNTKERGKSIQCKNQLAL